MQSHISFALPPPLFLERISVSDAILVAGPDGKILYKKNETKRCIPASTLKLLTALSAIHYFGRTYRFRTEFYSDSEQNLKIKGYGDPFLTSEVWRELADILSEKISNFRYLIIDDTYFSHNISIPGSKCSTNPYDAPVGALCANFNTVFFNRDLQGEILSAEPQTPMIPFARNKIRMMGLAGGRYTLTHDRYEAAGYAGKLLLYFLQNRGGGNNKKIRFAPVGPGDKLIFTYESKFTIEEVIKKMFEYSSNFIANQIFIAMGADNFGPPGNVSKGIRVITSYTKKELHLKDIDISEGSGISRTNSLSAMDMLAILKKFKPDLRLLKKEANVFYKSGTLEGVNTRAGYIEKESNEFYFFVIFMNRPGSDINSLMECVKKSLNQTDY